MPPVQTDVLEGEKIGNQKIKSTWWLHGLVAYSKKGLVNQQKDAQGLLMCGKRNLVCVVQSHRKATIAEIDKKKVWKEVKSADVTITCLPVKLIKGM